MVGDTQTQMTFEGFEIDSFRASLAAVALPLEGPISYGTKVRVTVEAVVGELLVKGDPEGSTVERVHKLKPTAANLEVL